MDPLARLFAEGFTYISFDLSKGAYVTAWHRHDRKTYQVRARTAEDAVEILLTEARGDKQTTTDSGSPVSSMFEDILG